jgi:glycosyltransferase involved in cell wall biosynthesis
MQKESDTHLPLITVITVVYNAASLIERTLKSVKAQTYPNIEHLIVDGLSKDQTLSEVEKYARPMLCVISEKDNGIYDAMNKGQALANGEFILFLNAGDEFYGNDVLENMLKAGFESDVYYGNTMVVDEEGIELGTRRLQPPVRLTWQSLQMGMCVSHQSLLVRKSICVSYDLQYKISADIDWTIRVLKSTKKVVNTKIIVSKFLLGGVSTSRRKQGLNERLAIMVHHYGWFRTAVNHGLIALRFVWHRITRKSMT